MTNEEIRNKLNEYMGKNVKITRKDGTYAIGKLVEYYNDTGEYEYLVSVDNRTMKLFIESKIESIEKI